MVTPRFDGRVAIVTGGGSGIGAATARRLAAEGASVGVADIRADAAWSVASSIGGLGLHCDVSDEKSVSAALDELLERYGRLDVAHSNAAVLTPEVYGRDQGLADMDVEVWDRTMAVNLRGAMLVVKHAAARMGSGGAIVVTSSVSGLVGNTHHPAYGTSKAALTGFIRYAATTYGSRGIRCNAIAPGLVMTEVARAAMSAERLAEKAAERVLPWQTEPDDVAALVAFLASDEARCITGQTIVVDSGITAHRPEHALKSWKEMI
jgi:NAD(P)-dependent dehydrogenase (short-subunit alcohol dehydrogenase family)